MKIIFASTVVALVLALTGGVHAAQGDVLWCAGSDLVVEETEPDSARVRLGEYTAERSGDTTIIVKYENEVVWRVEIPENVTAEPFTIIEMVKTLKDLCLMNTREQKLFEKLAELTVVPLLNRAGVAVDVKSDGAGFILILVLFILLIVIGAGFGV